MSHSAFRLALALTNIALTMVIGAGVVHALGRMADPEFKPKARRTRRAAPDE